MNPFIDDGGIVYGEKFVGRREALGLIEDRVVGGLSCLAIVGQGRMGKSSLAYHALAHQRKRLADQRRLVIWINLPGLQGRHDLFRKLLRCARDELEEFAPSVLEEGRVQRILEQAQRNEIEWLDLQEAVQQFFKHLKQRRDWHVIIILDEFDAARIVLRGDLQAFQTLRELAYQPEWRVGLVTLSRRSIKEIETQSSAISNLQGIFDTYYLPRFSHDELAELVKRVERANIAHSEELIKAVYARTGGHPYLSVKLLSQFVAQWLETHTLDIERAFEHSQLTFIAYYDELMRLLSEDESDRRLLEIVCGPVIKATPTDAREFEAYQLIRPVGDGYEGFSDHFTQYLRARQYDVDLWSLWTQTERALRDFIASRMQDRYGQDWETKVVNEHGRLAQIFNKCRGRRKEARKFRGQRASERLIDYADPWDYWQIIDLYWTSLGLQGTESEWEKRFKLIQAVRNPMAHSSEHSLTDEAKKEAEVYCRQLLNEIQRAQEHHRKE
ncbi:MAG: ATP-binding protein [Chloroflexi bacterium]|nr:ATP-binding protein [Chloroflexota bacterium]